MSQDPQEAEKAIAKTLRLRGTPAPVAQVSRRALLVVSAVLIVGVAGAVSWSLMDKRKPAAVEATYTPSPPPERVTALPRGYVGPASVPALGPPLPGDLGRPILSAARARQAGDPTALPVGGLERPAMAPAASAPVDPRIEAAREARRAAIQSGLFVTASVRRDTTPASGQGSGSGALGPSRMADGGQAGDPRTTSAERLQAPVSPYILQAGAIIPAALVTGLRSDAPGVAIAQVTQDVFDSLGGGVLLIPAGARLVGDYDAQVQSGQSRLRVVWTRLILPSGRSIVLDKLPGADAQGMAGLQDGVDRHGGRVLAAAGLSTLLATGAEAGSSSEESDLARAVHRAGADTASSVGQQMVGKSLDLAPTLTIRPGAPLRVLLTRDLVLEPYSERSLP
ncbi:conjugal transfer protein TrbI [Caulobacter sp. B11]|uniref:TrbI/VirB10 family protein n=1 Tax=Caulobacter sp. B11 TaxID=2048899 RepID=UPI000C12CD7D|nr:TrbI/VirB10 family protein [Caulobacter sp. B11]PHY13915.1 conjugal transfer protein TrbI [Caulobacter sp. B11]